MLEHPILFLLPLNVIYDRMPTKYLNVTCYFLRNKRDAAIGPFLYQWIPLPLHKYHVSLTKGNIFTFSPYTSNTKEDWRLDVEF